MPTTSNFGWTTPADTDLVKDGAAAIRTLGNGIDTSFLDLKGGTTGQNLRKNSNTDLDFTWAGDATNTVIDAEGDLLVGDSADTLQRLALGTDGQVLTVDTTVDGKIKWASPSSGSTYAGCYLRKSVAQNIPSATATAVEWDVEVLDSDGYHSNVTNNSRVTIPAGKAGKYLFIAQLAREPIAINSYTAIYWRKNGTIVSWYQNQTPNGVFHVDCITSYFIADLIVGDYVDIQFYTSTGAMDIKGNNTDTGISNFSATLIGA